MTRISTINLQQDTAGKYEEEIFDVSEPKRVIVCVHGGGVRRWDGEKFFYAVTEHYRDSVVMLVDQNQENDDYITVNPLLIAVDRVAKLITKAKLINPNVPIVVIGHSYGCGVASQLDLTGVREVVLVTPAAGRSFQNYIETYGRDTEKGKKITTSDHLKKEFTAEFMSSIKNISWEQEYAKLADGPVPVYVFEAGADEIVGDERFAHRDIPFAKYTILDDARHNLVGKSLADFFSRLDPLL